MADFITSHLVTGILECDNATKTELGQRMARHLRLQAGRSGPDGGIDGYATWEKREILFQAKLKKTGIGPDDAKIFWADLIRHRKTHGIYLAGMGYTPGFLDICQQMGQILEEMGRPVSCHLLVLADLFEKSKALQDAVLILPQVADLGQALVSP